MGPFCQVTIAFLSLTPGGRGLPFRCNMLLDDAIPIKFWLLLAVASGGVSLYFIVQLNLKHRGVPISRRFLWSFLLLFPFVGPLLYGALFRRIHPEDGDPGYAGGWFGGHGPGIGGDDFGGGSDDS